MSEQKRITVEHHESDAQLLEKYDHAVDHLCGLVQEAFTETPVILLSTYMRELIAEHAAKTKRLRDLFACRARLYVDNPGPPLTPPPG